jgi:hypothetical protein
MTHTTILLAFAMAMLISVPQVRAETPNIIIGPNMTVGSTGQGVVVLQGLMSEMGYLSIPSGISFGYYGSLTRNAVSKYQVYNNISPSVGYYGPITKSSMYSDLSRHGWLQMLGW